MSSEAIVADIQARQCPDGKVNIRGRTGVEWAFLYLLALWDGSSESFDAGHVRYPSAGRRIIVPSEAVVAHIQACQRPLGGVIIAISVNNSS